MKKNMIKTIACTLSLTLSLGLLSTPNIVHATEADSSTVDTSGIEMKKTAVYDPETKDYKITLEAYTKGTLSIVEKSKPLDVVFVLDSSGSMEWDFAGNKNPLKENSRGELLKKAASSILTDLEADAKKNSADHRAAFINFSNDLDNSSMIYYDSYFSGPWNDTTAQSKALMKINTKADSSTMKALDNAIYPEGSTYSARGLKGAQGILSNVRDTNRQKVVIFFTDGIDSELTNDTVNHESITAAKAIKDSGAMVFSVAIPAGSTENSLTSLDTVSNFLDYISSNYPEATNMKNSGTPAAEQQYKYQANSEIDLGNAFKKIFEIVTKPSSEIKNVTLKDYMSEYFNSPKPGDIKIYQQAYSGKDTWGERKTLSVDDGISLSTDTDSKEISVSGYDFNKNCVTEAVVEGGQSAPASGSKLVVEFHTDKIDGFIGGNNVPTNTDKAGLYTEKDTIIKPFDVPKVNVPLDFKAVANDASMYITSNISTNDAINILDADTTNKGLDFYNIDGKSFSFAGGIRNQFVNIDYTISTADGKTIGIYHLPAGQVSGSWTQAITTTDFLDSKDIKVTAKVTPKDSLVNGIDDLTANENAKIHVFKPTIQVKNSIVFSGSEANITNNTIGGITWTSPTSNNLPSDAAPVLSYKYHSVDKDGNIINADVSNPTKLYESANYTMSTTSNAVDISAHTAITNASQVKNANFKIDVVKGELQLTKKVDKAYSENTSINANQTFVFRIDVLDPTTKDKIETFYQSIDFETKDFNKGQAEKTITVKGLSYGIYEVHEETNWSWKYELKGSTTNYKNETNKLFIGESREGDIPYFGIQDGTTIDGKDLGNAGTIKFNNVLRSNINTLGDCADAINSFTK